MLQPGTHVGWYEIVALIGAGGMGEVYRARDTKLHRDVALKILPDALANSPDRVARFHREARLLAALNHPNVATLFGTEESTGAIALVMELVEGPTLADKLTGQLPATDAFAIARQLAEALEAAHDHGIIHRDLKPANIKIAASGTVKVLDFGLGRATTDEAAPDGSQIVTAAVEGTHAGAILGTGPYMSPEQARALPVDKRADIWAFGCVLYEMLAGRRAFPGDTLSDVIVSILEREPDWRSLPARTPPAAERLLRRCLEKDPRRRLRDIGEARVALDEILAAARGPIGSSRRLVTVGIGAAIVSTGLVTYSIATRSRPVSTTPAAIRASFARLTGHAGAEWYPNWSPDGKWIVYSAESDGNRDIFLQSVSGQTAINLTKDSPDADDEPAFSPDGERIAFRSERDGGGIFVMGRTGEAPKRISRVGFRPTWSPDGKQVAFGMEAIDVNPQNGRGQGPLSIVDVADGAAKQTSVDRAAQPSWSPHGHRIAYVANMETPNQRDIWTVSVETGEATPAVSGHSSDWSPAWSPDGAYLYFTSDRSGTTNLWRVTIDERTGKTSGEPEPLTAPTSFAGHAALSPDGRRIAYSAVLITTNVQALTFDPATQTVKGDPVWITTGSRVWSGPDPSPSGDAIVLYSRFDPEGHLHIVRSDGTALRQVTGDTFIDRMPRWSPDGRMIAFFSNRSGPYEIWSIRPDGSELTRLSPAGGGFVAWSPDGSKIATYRNARPELKEDDATYIFNVKDGPSGTPDFLPRMEEMMPGPFVANSWSPDGERIAGQFGYSASPGMVLYSIRSRSYDRLLDFGEYPVWLPDNRHLLFGDGGKNFWLYDVATRQPRRMFSGGSDVLGPLRLTHDGRTAIYTRRTTQADIWTVNLQ